MRQSRDGRMQIARGLYTLQRAAPPPRLSKRGPAAYLVERKAKSRCRKRRRLGTAIALSIGQGPETGSSFRRIPWWWGTNWHVRLRLPGNRRGQSETANQTSPQGISLLWGLSRGDLSSCLLRATCVLSGAAEHTGVPAEHPATPDHHRHGSRREKDAEGHAGL
jgi:hypothetical protein